MDPARNSIWFYLALALSSQASAVENLSWSSSVQEASRSNAEIKAAVASREAADQAVRSSRSEYYPQVSTSLGYSYGGVLAPDQSIIAGDSSSSKGSYNAGLNLTQTIFSGWSVQAQVDQSKASLSEADAQITISKAKVSSDLKNAYASLLFAQRLVRVQEDIFRRRQDNFRLVTLRYESGAENKGSVLLAEAYLAQARLDTLEASNNVRVARAQLAQVLGRDADDNLQVIDEVPSSEPGGTPPDFVSLARQSPSHRQAEASVARASAGVVSARAGYFPTLSFSGNLGRQGDAWFPNNENWTMGLSLNYPLFSGGRDRAQSYAAASNLTAAEANRSQSDRTLVSQLQDAYARWVEAIERVKVENSFYKAAQLRAEIARNKYNNGLLTFEDWDLIESDLISRQRSILQSQRDRIAAEAAWEQTQGKGVIR